MSTELPVPEHLDLGELIATLEAEDPAKVVRLGFRNPHSYRGYYEDLAFEVVADVTVGAMLADARSALGKTLQGYKGGDYDTTFEDRRVISDRIGRMVPVRDFLGDDFFRDLDTLRALNEQRPTRVVFWFDN